MKIKICEDLRRCRLRYSIQSHYNEITNVKFHTFKFFEKSIGSIKFIDSLPAESIACEDFRRLLREGVIKIVT
jgi:hypothetical protein